MSGDRKEVDIIGDMKSYFIQDFNETAKKVVNAATSGDMDGDSFWFDMQMSLRMLATEADKIKIAVQKANDLIV